MTVDIATSRNISKDCGVQRIVMSDSIGMYLNDIGKVPLLNAEEERELSRVIEDGRDAAERLASGEIGARLKSKAIGNIP